MDTLTMVAEPVALRNGVERLAVLMPTQVGQLYFVTEVEKCSTNMTRSLCGSSVITECV